VDAIVGAAKFMHTVITAECTGCELCIAPCPVDCIDLTRLPVQPSREEQRQNAVHYRLRYEARNTRIAHEEQQKKIEREARLSKAESTAPVASPIDPVQAAIARVKTQKNDSVDLNAALKKLKINASMANVALKKAERQLAQYGTPPLEEQVASLRQTAEAAQYALDNALKEASPSSPLQLTDTNAELKRAKVAAAMARAQLIKAEKAFGPEPTAEQYEQLNSLRISADAAANLLKSLESPEPTSLQSIDMLKAAKMDVVQARAALLSAERNHLREEYLVSLKAALIEAENKLYSTEAASERPAPQHMRAQKTSVASNTRALKTQIAYAKAEVSRLERSSNAAPEHLNTARMHLSMLEQKLSEGSIPG
jgi:electron transport complex protein RnfB